ncbi:MAG TPA: hypothetical protein VEX39_16435 [Thermoleophilaceae bacterium]|nr:hypothetical protein [Thermoleophilaceae bacterium]
MGSSGGARLAVAGLTVLLFCAVAPAASARTYYPDCNDRYASKYKPAKIQLCVGILRQLRGLKWTSWRAGTARAKGRYVYQTCKPTCVEGPEKRLAARVVLYRKRRCPGRNVFTRMKIIAKGEPRTPFKIRCKPL